MVSIPPVPCGVLPLERQTVLSLLAIVAALMSTIRTGPSCPGVDKTAAVLRAPAALDDLVSTLGCGLARAELFFFLAKVRIPFPGI